MDFLGFGKANKHNSAEMEIFIVSIGFLRNRPLTSRN
jgi:hypothetical protein